MLLKKNPNIRIAISGFTCDTHLFWKRFPSENYEVYSPSNLAREFNTGCISYVLCNKKLSFLKDE